MAMNNIEKARPISLKDLEKLKAEIENNIKALINVPHGAIMWFNLTAAPTGWVICDGTNGTPNLIDRYPLGSTSDIGSTVEAGLPNIVGRIPGDTTLTPDGNAYWDVVSGAFYKDTTETDVVGNYEADYDNYIMGFDASRGTVYTNGKFMAKEDSPYGKSNTVTPPSVKLLPCMKL